jgi:hypothetical protein
MMTCWSVVAGAIDREVASLLLTVVQPPQIELGLAVTREAERQAKELDEQWRLRLERARYEARLAERRYKAVDPDNRVVARALEREWEEKLRELDEVERKMADGRREKKIDLDAHDRARLLALSRNLAVVWAAPSTTMAERKNIVRTLIHEVCITPLAKRSGTRVQILWHTGATSTLTVQRQFGGLRTSAEAKNLIAQMVRQGRRATEIAQELNARGLFTASGRPWTNNDVQGHCKYQGVRWSKRMPCSIPLPERRADGLYSTRGVAAQLGVSVRSVRYWVQRRWLKNAEGGAHLPLWFRLDQALIHKLEKLRDKHSRAQTRCVRRL